MYNPLWEDHPKVKELRAEGEAKALQREVNTLQHAIVTVVRTRYPSLTELAQQKVAHINKPDALDYLLGQISAQKDEAGVRALLLPTVA